MNPRKKEFILTLIAGITGIIAGLFGMLSGSLFNKAASSSEVQDALSNSNVNTEQVSTLGGTIVAFSVIALLLAIVLIVLAFFINKNVKVIGIITLICGGVGFFIIGFLWVVPGVLAIIAGFMCLLRKVSA